MLRALKFAIIGAGLMAVHALVTLASLYSFPALLCFVVAAQAYVAYRWWVTRNDPVAALHLKRHVK